MYVGEKIENGNDKEQNRNHFEWSLLSSSFLQWIGALLLAQSPLFAELRTFHLYIHSNNLRIYLFLPSPAPLLSSHA